MRLRTIPRLAALLGLPVIVGGCADAIRTPFPAKSYFMIDPGQPESSSSAAGASAAIDAGGEHSAAPSNDMLRVRLFRMAAPYEGTAFVTKLGPDQYTHDYYSGFFVAPDRMLTADACEWLKQSRLFTRVIDAGARVNARYSLDGTITGLYADYTGRRNPHAVFSAEFTLTDESDGSPQILFVHSYSASAPITGAGPAGIAQAWNHACRTVLDELTADLGRHNPTVAGVSTGH